MFQVPGFIADGAVLPGRVVLISGPFKVKQVATAADSTDRRIVGISATQRRRPQGFADSDKHAIDGEPVRVYGDGEVALAQAQASISPGDLLIAHDDGRVKPLPASPSAGEYVVVGKALHAAAADEYVRVYVNVQLVKY